MCVYVCVCVFLCVWVCVCVCLCVYAYSRVSANARQLLIALQHIHRMQIIHADIKPDNILISAGHNLVKICDLGSAMDLTEVEAAS